MFLWRGVLHMLERFITTFQRLFYGIERGLGCLNIIASVVSACALTRQENRIFRIVVILHDAGHCGLALFQLSLRIVGLGLLLPDCCEGKDANNDGYHRQRSVDSHSFTSFPTIMPRFRVVISKAAIAA